MKHINNKETLVIKLGGVAGIDFAAICQDIATLYQDGRHMILVHGGSEEANTLGEALGRPPRFITSPSGFTSRFTDRETLEVFAMAVNGKVNTFLVEQLQTLGVNAIGLSGLDGQLLIANRKDAIQAVQDGKRKIIRGDYTGKITAVNVQLLKTLLSGGYLPVIAPLASSAIGIALNIDADRAAGMIAGAVQAETLLLLTAAPGLLRAFPDESSLIKHLPAANLDQALPYAQGRMKKKLLGTKEAILGGVSKVIIADGRIAQPVLQALDFHGTLIQ